MPFDGSKSLPQQKEYFSRLSQHRQHTEDLEQQNSGRGNNTMLCGQSAGAQNQRPWVRSQLRCLSFSASQSWCQRFLSFYRHAGNGLLLISKVVKYEWLDRCLMSHTPFCNLAPWNRNELDDMCMWTEIYKFPLKWIQNDFSKMESKVPIVYLVLFSSVPGHLLTRRALQKDFLLLVALWVSMFW